MRLVSTLALHIALLTVVEAKSKDGTDLCPGYQAFNVSENAFGLRADLILSGDPCDVYGTDVQHLVLTVAHETNDRLHVKIQDVANRVYQVPEAVFPRPGGRSRAKGSTLGFTYSISPFSFSIIRRATGEVLFDTSRAPLIFETQFVRLRTRLPTNPNIYGLGEHADSFRLPISKFTRTLWNRESHGMRKGRNLYGSHPFYMDHRGHATHGVFLLNSNGMDIKIDNYHGGRQHLEYNTVGGVLDFWFLGGPSPVDVAKQYSEIVGRPAMQPYWALGFHQSRHGYRDVYELARVVSKYEEERIPLEAIWSDADYMDRNRIFTLDSAKYPLTKMQAFLNHLHSRNQRYVAVVNPGVPFHSYPPFHHGIEDQVFLRRPNGSLWVGRSWTGNSVFPDWFSEKIQPYYNKMFGHVFAKDTGIDVDGISLDTNEPSLYKCKYPCISKWATWWPKRTRTRKPPRKGLEGWPCELQRQGQCKHADGILLEKQPFEKFTRSLLAAQAHTSLNITEFDILTSPFKEPLAWQGLHDRCLTSPDYKIKNQRSQRHNARQASSFPVEPLSAKTIDTDVRHQNGLAMYDTHNLYGNMMASVVREAIQTIRPGERPFIISRSTFAGGGAKAGHALGDNMATNEHFLESVRSLLSFASMFQFSMVGSDVCGYAKLSDLGLCARWVALGAFYPFFRNHNALNARPQELYEDTHLKMAARRFVRIRYRLLDYLYTAFWRASMDGTPVVSPLWFQQPLDEKLWSEEVTFNFGPSMLIAPLPFDAMFSTQVYLPDDRFYTWNEHKPIEGDARLHTFTGGYEPWQPIMIRGASIIPTRETWALTTTELRKQGFELLVALDRTGRFANGQLYLDDGISSNTTNRHSIIDFFFHIDNATLSITGIFNAPDTNYISKITVLGAGCTSKSIQNMSKDKHTAMFTAKQSRTLFVDVPLNASQVVKLPAHELKCFGERVARTLGQDI
ncbi:hypothetical protein CDD81_7590 [Ophiocordyceps australis]|uniref:Alpha-glucosidase n=1 Tax=Ophiocordyceps australis TaxID=1399860 RepID=A0A2C5Y084_9HYPO|nr:hypothetical protein CDD81_7590 [Ophiocordyceps australis]